MVEQQRVEGAAVDGQRAGHAYALLIVAAPAHARDRGLDEARLLDALAHPERVEHGPGADAQGLTDVRAREALALDDRDVVA